MNFMVYPSSVLNQKMMDEWAALPVESRKDFISWCRVKTLAVLEKNYGLS